MDSKIGLEIHQRLDTRKLHCHCYANPSEEKSSFHVDGILQRQIAAVGGELGEVDVAAAFEAGKKTVFEYLVDERFSCTVESDENPPFALNEQALAIALSIAKALNADPVDEIHVMRKTIVDGSAVSGFQRTALVATGGFLETSRGRVGIQTIALEEESAGIVEKTSEKFTYRLDRLGIPLVEIATAPDIQDGLHAKEVAEKIGNILRATGKVQRGLGSIRQDLNVSIDGGERVELKGVQDLKLLPKIISGEIERQKREGVKKGGETRRIEGIASEFMRPLAGAARIYPETDVPHVRVTNEILAKAAISESIEDKAKWLESLGVNAQLAERMAKAREMIAFEMLFEKSKADATLIASTLLETITSLRREGVPVDGITVSHLADVFSLFAQGKIAKTAIPEVIREMAVSGKTAEQSAEDKKLWKFSEKELDALVKSGKNFGEIMREHRLRVDAAELQKKLKR